MKFAALVVALLCALPQIATLRAQQGGEPDSKKAVNGNKADATPEAATKPIRFTKFPVPEATPLDADIAVERAVVRLLQLKEGDGDQWPYEGVYREDRGQLPVGYRVGGTAIVCLSLLAAKGYAKQSPKQQGNRLRQFGPAWSDPRVSIQDARVNSIISLMKTSAQIGTN